MNPARCGAVVSALREVDGSASVGAGRSS
jgi:hypothetical protein